MTNTGFAALVFFFFEATDPSWGMERKFFFFYIAGAVCNVMRKTASGSGDRWGSWLLGFILRTFRCF